MGLNILNKIAKMSLELLGLLLELLLELLLLLLYAFYHVLIRGCKLPPLSFCNKCIQQKKQQLQLQRQQQPQQLPGHFGNSKCSDPSSSVPSSLFQKYQIREPMVLVMMVWRMNLKVRIHF